MNRREFLKAIIVVPAILSVRELFARNLDDLKSFGYYQGLLPKEKRDPRRTDGTYSSMPLILRADIDAGEAKTYKFWHGHGGKNHMFTLTEEDMDALHDEKTIEVFTSVVDGHRHAVRVIGKS